METWRNFIRRIMSRVRVGVGLVCVSNGREARLDWRAWRGAEEGQTREVGGALLNEGPCLRILDLKECHKDTLLCLLQMSKGI